MIDQKYRPFVFAFFMALLMSCIMSFMVTLINMGWVDNIWRFWLRAWGLSFLVALPAVTMVAPVVNKLVSLVIKK